MSRKLPRTPRQRLTIMGCTLVACAAFVLISAVLAGSLTFEATAIQWLVCIGVIVGSLRRHTTRPLAAGVGTAVIIVIALSCLGFYLNGKSTGGYDDGGTWIESRSPVMALLSTTMDPIVFPASLFGFSCNYTYGENCTAGPYYAGLAVVEGTLAAGAVSGLVFARRRIETEETLPASAATPAATSRPPLS